MAKQEDTATGTIDKAPSAAPTYWISPFDEIDRLFDEFLSSSLLRPGLLSRGLRPELRAFAERAPRIDLLDRESEIVVRAELPGVDKKDLEVTVSDNSLTIRATTSHESEEESGEYYRREISRGSLARTVPLPAIVDAGKAKADFKNGILEVTLPKLERSRRRRIEIG